MGDTIQQGCCGGGGKFTVAHVTPLIRDARLLGRSIEVLDRMESDTTYLKNIQREVLVEIGRKVADAVEVDA